MLMQYRPKCVPHQCLWRGRDYISCISWWSLTSVLQMAAELWNNKRHDQWSFHVTFEYITIQYTLMIQSHASVVLCVSEVVTTMFGQTLVFNLNKNKTACCCFLNNYYLAFFFVKLAFRKMLLTCIVRNLGSHVFYPFKKNICPL